MNPDEASPGSSLIWVHIVCKMQMREQTTFEPWHGISNNVVCVTSKASDQPAHTGSLIRTFASRLNIL